MMRARTGYSVSRGFTLIESMGAIVILGILGSLASTMVLDASDDYVDAATRTQLSSELNAALERITRELRMIPEESGVGTAPDIDTVTASSIDWNDSGADAYTLSVTGTTLNFVIDGAAASILLSDVSAFTVQTYDESNSALGASLSGASCDAIRRVDISITQTRHAVSETLGTKVFIRSTMSGAPTT